MLANYYIPEELSASLKLRKSEEGRGMVCWEITEYKKARCFTHNGPPFGNNNA
jgi:hypothetical protein